MYMIKMSDLNPALLCSVVTIKVSSRFKKKNKSIHIQIYEYKYIHMYTEKQKKTGKHTHFLSTMRTYCIHCSTIYFSVLNNTA